MNRLHNSKNKKKQILFIIYAAIILVAIITGIICWVSYNAQLKQNEDLYKQLSIIIESGKPIPDDKQTTNVEKIEMKSRIKRKVKFYRK